MSADKKLLTMLVCFLCPSDLHKYRTQKTHQRITHDNQPSSGQLQTPIAHSSSRAAVAPTAAAGKQSKATAPPFLTYGEVGVVRDIERC